METYLARADRVISDAEAMIARQRLRLEAIRADGNDAEFHEGRAALALMVERLAALRHNRILVQKQITRPAR